MAGDWPKATTVAAHTNAAAMMPFDFGNIPIQLPRRAEGSDGGVPVHLCDEGPEQELSRWPRGAEGHLAIVSAGGQDRGAGPERRREVDLAAHHGGRRARLRRRGLDGRGRAGRLSASDAEIDALVTAQGELQEKIDHAGAWDLDRTVEIAMDALRCPPGDAEVATLSGGERRRVAL